MFPLPLVPFESMMLYDDRPSYPMTCAAMFEFEGDLRRAAFEQAVALASRRHPLLCSYVRQTRRNQWAWMPAETPPRVAWLGTEKATEFARCMPLDLRREIGLRIWVRDSGRQPTIHIEFHHACCDGAGGLAFIEDLFAFYAAQFGRGKSGQAALPKIDPSLLCGRSHFPMDRRILSRIRTALADAVATWNLVGRCAMPLAYRETPRFQADLEWQKSRFVTRRFDKKLLTGLRKAATACGATVNDLLLRDLYLAIDEWNQYCGAVGSNNRLRIVIPVNLRTRSDLKMSAANKFGYMFVTRHEQHLAKPDELLATLTAEAAKLRRTQFPVRFVRRLAMMKALGFGFPVVFSPRRCLATAIMSNLGDPTRRFRTRFPRHGGLIQVGNLMMTAFSATTPLRPLTRAGFFFNTYGNQLTISARFDPTYFSVTDVRTFLDFYTARFQATAGQRQQPRRLAA